MVDLTKIVEELSSLTVMEAAELSKLLEEKWGVSASIPVASKLDSTDTTSDNSKVSEAEKTEFDVLLLTPGEKKINVIKAVRSITGLGLKEAKALVDSVPSPIKSAVSKDEADKAKSELEQAGGTVEVR